jgi:hypothetical protein
LLIDLSKNLDKPEKLAQDYILARVYKMIQFKTGLEMDERFEKDYFTFNSMLQ